MIRRFAAVLLVAVILTAALAGGGMPVEATPIAVLGLAVVIASPGVRSYDLSSFPASPALRALASSHRLPRASLILDTSEYSRSSNSAFAEEGVSLKRILGKTLVYLVLEVGALCGVPMRPDEIEQIMKMSEPRVTQVLRNDEGDGKEPKVEP